MPQVSKLAIAGCLSLWAAGILFGTRYLSSYSNTPGETAMPVERWPVDTALHLGPNGTTLLVAIHPQCTCSAASVEELRKAVARSGEHPLIYALVYHPSNEPEAWSDTSAVRAVRKIPGSRIVIDRDGADIDKFHARVSGEVFLYDARGSLRFKGGVTARRGHPGESKGSDALTTLLRHTDLPFVQTPVFGCSLRNVIEAAETAK
jgi:hypothetical protein